MRDVVIASEVECWGKVTLVTARVSEVKASEIGLGWTWQNLLQSFVATGLDVGQGSKVLAIPAAIRTRLA